jgi:hypothetical protein
MVREFGNAANIEIVTTMWIVLGPNGAAARLGMKRQTLRAGMLKLGISRRQVVRDSA